MVVASQRALAKLESRSTPIPAYYGSLKRWLPIMQVDRYYILTAPGHLDAWSQTLKPRRPSLCHPAGLRGACTKVLCNAARPVGAGASPAILNPKLCSCRVSTDLRLYIRTEPES